MSIKGKFTGIICQNDLGLVCVGGAGTGAPVYEGVLNAPAKVARAMNPDDDVRVVLPSALGLSIECADEFTALPMITDIENGARICDSFVRTDEIMLIWDHEGETYLCLHDPEISFATTLTVNGLIAKTGIDFTQQFVPAMKQNVFVSSKFPKFAEALKSNVVFSVGEGPQNIQ